MLAATSSSSSSFVDLTVPVWAWIALLAVIAAMLGIDLYRHREAHAPTTREALTESIVWVSCGLAFSVVIAVAFGGDAFGEYISGYLIEKSLSVDNVFVWSMLFATLAIPVKYQHRVLFWGIFGALFLRAAFILLGTALIGRFWWILLVFGVFLVYTGVKIIRHRADEGQSESTRGIGLLRRIMPVSDQLDGQKFFTRINARRAATPLLAALVVVEITDIIFAVDSVPAILAVSHEPFLVFASNAFAILGLRAMYFLLANAKEKFHFLSHALGGILIFVGVKMAVSHWYHMNTYLSLAIIMAMLVVAIVLSVRRAGSLDSGTHDGHDRGVHHDHQELPPVLDQAFWDERYSSADRVWSGNPNPQLVSDVSGLPAGRALDVGAGEGADAIWLAEHGWTVTAVDISPVALERGRHEAERGGAEVAGRITWTPIDVLADPLPEGAFDLVSLQFMHFSVEDRVPLFARCAAAVAPGGTLQIVGHHPSDLDTTVGRWPMPDRFYTADELAASLDAGWTVLAADVRPRQTTDAEGRPVTIHDAVLVARRTATPASP